MEKTIAIKENGRKVYVTIRLDLNNKQQYCFAVSGHMRGMYGQCLDEIREYIGTNNILFNIIYDMWKKYHLNDMHAGTEKQEELIHNYFIDSSYDYNGAVTMLKECGCYIDNGYEYGSSWLYREIPQEDLCVIKKILKYC